MQTLKPNTVASHDAMAAALAAIEANSVATMARRQRVNTDRRVVFLSQAIDANYSLITEGGYAGLSQMADQWGTPAYFRRLRAKQLYLVRRAILADGVSHRAGEVLAYCAELRREEKAALAAHTVGRAA